MLNPAMLSKINWTQAVAFLASMAAIFGFDLPPELQATTVVAIQALQSILTWVFRTWFTGNE